MTNHYTIYDRPPLRSPHFVMALSGWPNAGEVATSAVKLMRDQLAAKRLAEIYPEDFFDFTIQRPMVVVEKGLLRRLRPPSNIFYYYRNPASEHDLILLLGAEPHLHWAAFVDCVLAILHEFNVYRAFVLGGMYDRVSHRREPKVSGSASNPEMRSLLYLWDIEPSSYQGPSSLHTTFMATAHQRGVEGISIWGHVPQYVQSIANPKACRAVLNRLAPQIEVDLDLRALEKSGRYLDRTLDAAINQNDQLRQMVEKLEGETGGQPPDGPTRPLDIEAGHLISEVEDFLRREQGASG
jgi:proteasome assembly chaperone (PAC2) family protein